MSDSFLEEHEIDRLKDKKVKIRDELLDWIDINFSKLNQYEKEIVLLTLFQNCFESQLVVVSKVYGFDFQN